MNSETSKKPAMPANKFSEDDDVFQAVGNVCNQLSAIEKFIARRFDELSMEINATSQQMDMVEEGYSKKLAEIMEVIRAISFQGEGLTQANTGVELNAVVEMTENAANRILDAADRIAGRVHDNWDNEEKRTEALQNIDKDIEEIFIACSFQDITGQRIRQTLKNLKLVEERLGTALSNMGIEVENTEGDPELLRKAHSQDEVDSIFREKREKEAGISNSQDDIDSLFED